MIASSRMPVALACRHYEERALPVLGYLAHFSDPPSSLTSIEIHMLHRLLHLPMNAASLNTFALWHSQGGPRLASAGVTCVCVCVRLLFVPLGCTRTS